MCKIPTKSLKLDKNLPKNVRKMFVDVGSMSADIQKRLTKTIEFQKFQKSLQLKIENKKSAMRRDHISKTNKKEQEFNGQLAKLSSFEENNRKKLEETLHENEKLRDMIRAIESKKAATTRLVEDEDDDFFLRNTPTTSSCPSVTGSTTDNEDMFQFDLLGLNNRSNSSSSSSSSQSNRAGSLF